MLDGKELKEESLKKITLRVSKIVIIDVKWKHIDPKIRIAYKQQTEQAIELGNT